MFTEVLRIKPYLDSASAKAMEANLSRRFTMVAKRFRSGMMSALKASVLGISLGLLNRLLNPIEALEEKIKSLLGSSQDIREMAEDFNTSPGQLKRLQDVSQSLGVQPEDLKEMLTKYAQAVETARDELANPLVKPSDQTQAVRQFVGEKDMAESFLKFLTSLRAEGAGAGRKQILDSKGGITRQLNGLESRQDFEKTVFGEKLRGNSKRLVETDLAAQLVKLGEPSAAVLTGAINKTATLSDQQRLMQTKNDTADFLATSGAVDSNVVAAMEQARATEQGRVTRQLKSYDDLRQAADGIEKLKTLMEDVANVATRGVGYLGKVADWVEAAKGSPLFRMGMFGISGKGK